MTALEPSESGVVALRLLFFRTIFRSSEFRKQSDWMLFVRLGYCPGRPGRGKKSLIEIHAHNQLVPSFIVIFLNFFFTCLFVVKSSKLHWRDALWWKCETAAGMNWPFSVRFVMPLYSFRAKATSSFICFWLMLLDLSRANAMFIVHLCLPIDPAVPSKQ